ncbi:TPA: DNA methylase [Pseudomonas aeruginosa]|nr:site-specific DNA-methyltransferase [Pseudomonas aeruginosa]HBO6193724.1 site-specific DNA-methyltransferase [Pseudomonas aeruginosa]HBP0714968.1 site-specific DNA-methyltransferase [Pseudomonas aeruginosa]HCG0728345.1 DNA methylase [Pseudomonas aeruginosa]HCG1519586.1 DNA methylase [Pseudomonas aeruginosa]
MTDLFSTTQKKTGPVECLGQTFPSDEARREHYLKLLAEKLKDPEFRKIEGFPIGSDEDILALSDPPYYTACPNPFINKFVEEHITHYDSSIHYKTEPFLTDVSEGKNDPIYNAHSYHTKVPHKAIMRFILHYTQPGEVVLDSFCGTGMTGVAAQLCGDRKVVESLGYRVESDGTILKNLDIYGKNEWTPFSKLGARVALLNEISPAASFIASNYNAELDVNKFHLEAKRILQDVIDQCGWMYETSHSDGRTVGRINFTLWSDVFSCPNCADEIVFWDVAADKEAGKVLDKFSCPHCATVLGKKGLDRAWTSFIDSSTGLTVRQAKQVPVLINYSVGKSRFEKKPDQQDLDLIERILTEPVKDWFPSDRMIEGGETRRNDSAGITHVHHFYTRRNLIVLARFRERIFSMRGTEASPGLGLWFTSSHVWATRLNRLLASNYFGGGGGVIGQTLQGTLYVSSLAVETNCIERFSLRISSVPFTAHGGSSLVSTGSAERIPGPDNSVDYVFVDPPFGANIMYSELNSLWEAWLKVRTNPSSEAIESPAQKKSLDDYRALMTKSFREAFRLLKPGRWMTVEFSNTKAAVWNGIQTALQEAGFVVANVAALEKSHKGYRAVTTTTAVKQDLVISAYKPNGGLEERFKEIGGTDDSVWDFVRTHLGYLPSVKIRAGELDFVSERDPRIIFDRMVAWFVRHGTAVPMSSHEFQAGLLQRFVERDGMFFLPEQVTEYDKKRMQVAIAPQMEMFVSDERSAIDWLSDFLKRRPSTYQEIGPEFMGQLGAGWKKHETKPELLALLEDNFLKYGGTGEVPSQIHSYLSTNHKDLRGLEKNDPALVAKAKDRWYVPDPNKAQDLEKKREKALLKEFDQYRAFTGRRLKEFRLEALRAGFRTAWGNKDYQTIIDIAAKVPDAALQEDEKLLTLYDLALTRTEDGI